VCTHESGRLTCPCKTATCCGGDAETIKMEQACDYLGLAAGAGPVGEERGCSGIGIVVGGPAVWEAGSGFRSQIVHILLHL